MSARPFVLVNMAMTADGKIDTVARVGVRISGPADTARVDQLRAESDAVMVGGRTLLGEDPRLTIRDESLIRERVRSGRPPQPTKIGLATRIGSRGDEHALPDDSRFLAEGDTRVIIFTTAHTDDATIAGLEARGATVVVNDGARVDLANTMAKLRDMGVERLMVEGGSTLMAALLAAELVDELQLAVAPRLFGGETAPTPVGGPGWPADEAIPLTLRSVVPSADGDVVLRYDVGRARQP